MKTKAQLEEENARLVRNVLQIKEHNNHLAFELNWHRQANQTFMEIMLNASKEANFPPRRSQS